MTEIEKIVRVIKENSAFLITSHLSPDGDSIASQLALRLILKRLKKSVVIANHDPVPDTYVFLPGSETIRVVQDAYPSGPARHRPEPKAMAGGLGDEKFDVAVILDCSELSRVANLNSNIIKTIKEANIIINIDHHPGNEYFGHLNLVDAKKSAVGEQIYELIEPLGCKLNEDLALCLYVGILTDTGSFRYLNTTTMTHRIVAELLATGVRPHQVAQRIYDTATPSSIKLLSLTLATLRTNHDGKVAWMSITREMLEDSGVVPSPTEGFIDHCRSLKDSEVAILFMETLDDKVEVSFRSKNTLNVDRLARTFGGGGHIRAAACTINGTLEGVARRVLAEVSRQMKTGGRVRRI